MEALDVFVERNVSYQASADDDDDELSHKKHDGDAPLPTEVSAASEDYVEERYKVDRRKLEQMIQGKQNTTPTTTPTSTYFCS